MTVTRAHAPSLSPSGRQLITVKTMRNSRSPFSFPERGTSLISLLAFRTVRISRFYHSFISHTNCSPLNLCRNKTFVSLSFSGIGFFITRLLRSPTSDSESYLQPHPPSRARILTRIQSLESRTQSVQRFSACDMRLCTNKSLKYYYNTKL